MNVIDFWNLSVEYFKNDIDKFLETPQPFDRFDDMMRTVQGRNIFNTTIPCDPKKSGKFIMNDISRWIYVIRIIGYFMRQYLKQREQEGKNGIIFKKLNSTDPSFSKVPLEIDDVFKIESIKRTISSAFKNSWQIKYDSTFRTFNIEVNMESLSDSVPERLVQVGTKASTILGNFIIYFKEVAPRSVFDKMAMTYAADVISLNGISIH